MNQFSKTNSDMVFVVKFSDGTYYTGSPYKIARTNEIDEAKVYTYQGLIAGDILLDNYSKLNPTNQFVVIPMEIRITVEKNEIHEV